MLATISEGGKGALPPVSASPVIGRVASISRRRPSSTSISNMVEAESSTGVSSAMEKIENAVSLLKDVDSADGTAPAAQTPSQGNGSIMWPAILPVILLPLWLAVRDLLVQALKLLRPANRRKSSSSVDSASFAQIVALTDLDDVSR